MEKYSLIEYEFEKLSEKISVCVSPEHRFGTDAILLAHYCNARRNDKVCDLGTGCGIIPLAIYRNFTPKIIYGIDIQEQAIEQFNLGVEKSELSEVVKPLCIDLKEITTVLHKSEFDVITCNPPYKLNHTGLKNAGDAHTIARHEVLCTIDDVCESARQLLRFGGKLCICQRPERLADVLLAMRKSGIEPKRLRFVSKNAYSAPWLFLVEGKKGSQSFLQVEKPLFMYEQDGTYTKEVQEIYNL